ncbi:hypothetical protein [Embleya sp. MST-111070]|uniref:hypothetical protein n=1 Tax=Embleya sp. MST-111070 TaxID=3398231 RepID=UPI003F731924
MVDIEADTPPTPLESQGTARLLALARTLDVKPVDLDEAVHDAAARYGSDGCNATGVTDNRAADALYDEAGNSAADINNDGLGRQVPYLVSQHGAVEAERIIREAACGA